MSAIQLINTLENLLNLYKRLHEIATQKIEILKKNDMEALKKSIKEEQNHIIHIQKFEKEREQEVYKLMSGFEIKGDVPTISDCIEIAPEPEKSRLKELQENLLYELTEVKNMNYLNQQLTQQSLQFVSFSLELLRPQLQEINYGRPNQKKKPKVTSYSAFDSKA